MCREADNPQEDLRFVTGRSQGFTPRSFSYDPQLNEMGRVSRVSWRHPLSQDIGESVRDERPIRTDEG